MKKNRNERKKRFRNKLFQLEQKIPSLKRQEISISYGNYKRTDNQKAFSTF